MQKPKANSSLKESLSRKLETKDEIGKVNKGRKNNNNDNLKEKANSDSVVKVKVKVEKVEVVNKEDKKCNSLKEKIDVRLKSIERDIIQTDSLTELTKKMKILNTPLETDRERDITVLNTTEFFSHAKALGHFRPICRPSCNRLFSTFLSFLKK